MDSVNKNTHFIMFVPKSDIGELDRIPEADEELKKECWAKLKGHDIEKVSGLSIYDIKPGCQYKPGMEVTEVQQIGTGAVLVTVTPLLY